MNGPRKLVAILALDVVGYSRMIGNDEEGTIQRLRALRSELIDASTGHHRGRVIKAMGDGFLIEFASVVDAVRCAIDVQQGAGSRNTGVPPDLRIELRAGVNVGDVVIEGDDLLGDGVNVAAGLESIAEPGGICISESAYQYVRDKIDVIFIDAGPQTLKTSGVDDRDGHPRMIRGGLSPKWAGPDWRAAKHPARCRCRSRRRGSGSDMHARAGPPAPVLPVNGATGPASRRRSHPRRAQPSRT